VKFEQQLEHILVTLYEIEAEHGWGDGDNVSWNFESAFRVEPRRVDVALASAIKKEFVRRGYAKFIGDLDGIKLLPRGEAAAIEILEARRSRSFPQRILEMPWTSILAFVSAVAAVIAAVPVVRDLLK
jgi:hypothetical protein